MATFIRRYLGQRTHSSHGSKAIFNLHTHSFSIHKSAEATCYGGDEKKLGKNKATGTLLDGADGDYVEQPHVDGSNIFSIQNYESVNNNASVTMPEEYWRKLNEDISDAQNNYFDNPKVLRKKIIWSARKRGWAEAGDLLNAFIDSGGIDMIDDADLKNFYRLLVCDDMFLMCLIAKTKECPSELEGKPLKLLQLFASEYIVESR
jgi:succinate dehydrogenase flavin-adding protein (antitoxin of CptAB toxin-antitoxin module)